MMYRPFFSDFITAYGKDPRYNTNRTADLIDIPGNTILLALDEPPGPPYVRHAFGDEPMGRFVVGGTGAVGWLYWDIVKPVE